MATNYRTRAEKISQGAEEWYSGATPYLVEILAGEDAQLLSAEVKKFGWHVQITDDDEHTYLVISPEGE